MKHCGLAPLSGRGGLSGDILSHDFVEAALMRRAGWHVWLVPDLYGSYEQQPPNLLEELQRDRRWCQGNLQNARLLAEPGLHGVHRAMLLTGAFSYLSAPLWLAFVLLGACLWVFGNPPAFASLRDVPRELAALWLATTLMLALPRPIGVLAIVMRREQGSYGGTSALLRGTLLEGGLSVLQAPVRMVAHTLFVVAALTGLKLDWRSPSREAEDIGWIAEAVEPSFLGDQPGRSHECAPGRARQRTADADAPNPERCDLRDGQLARMTDQQIDGLRRDPCHHGGDLLARTDARRVQAVG